MWFFKRSKVARGLQATKKTTEAAGIVVLMSCIASGKKAFVFCRSVVDGDENGRVLCGLVCSTLS